MLEIDGIKKTYREYLGETTNNQAEYRALLLGLQKAKELAAEQVVCYLDSELVVKQLNREYRVKEPSLQPLFIQVWNAAQAFQKATFQHVPRTQNKEADALVNLELDERQF